MRIVHVLRGFPFGGAQQMAINLAREQAARGDDIAILLTGRERISAQRALEGAHDLETWFAPGNPLAQVRYARRQLARWKPDVIHLHLAPSWMGFAIPAGSPGALVGHLHSRPALQVHTPTLKLRLHSFADRALLRRCDRLIAVSEWAAQAWRTEDPALDPEVMFNGVAMPEDRPKRDTARADRPFTLGIALRLSERKGMDEFLAIADLVHRRDPAIRFAVAGDGPQADDYKRKAVQLGLGDKMEFRGFVTDIAAFWRSVDLGAFTSAVDTFGLGMVEPVSSGCPVIAYRTGTGGDEVIDRCRGVESVPFGDESAFAEKVIALRQQPERLDDLAATGFADCREHFSLARMAAKVDAIYHDALIEDEAA